MGIHQKFIPHADKLQLKQLFTYSLRYIILYLHYNFDRNTFHRLQIICLDVLLALDVFLNDATWARKILDVIGLFFKIYPAIQLALFCVLVKIISLQLKAMRKRIVGQFIPCHPASNSSLALVEMQRSQLVALRSHHLLICKTICQLNRFFGVFLTLEVIFIFISVINCSLFVFMSALSADALLGGLNTAICLDSLVHLFFLTSFSDDITNQVPH
jgi:hypothetical protein